MKWAIYAGLTFDFLSFWLVIPEIMGERLLKALRRAISTGSRMFVWVISVLVAELVGGVVYIGCIFALTEIYRDIRDVPPWATLVILLVFTVVGLVAMIFSRNFMYQRWLEPILVALSDDRRFRRQVFITGCVLFTLGFIFQIIGATY